MHEVINKLYIEFCGLKIGPYGPEQKSDSFHQFFFSRKSIDYERIGQNKRNHTRMYHDMWFRSSTIDHG